MNLNVFAHGGADLMTDLSTDTTDKWSWGEPLGLAVFMVGVTLTLYLLALTIKTLASIDPEQKNKKSK